MLFLVEKMLMKSIYFCLAFVIIGSYAAADQVSFPPFGNFTKDPPFHKSWMLLPQSPSSVGTQFHLFTRASQGMGQQLNPLKRTSIKSSDFVGTKSTVFISHGYTGSIDSPLNKPMTSALLQRGDFNVIVVAWKEGSYASYHQAAANCRLVGAQIGYLIAMLHSETGLPFSKVHVVGYSLGGQVAGYAGTYLRKMGHKLGRITALDPAAPLFEHEDIEVRIDKSDAEFVDVIHTNTQKVAVATGIGMATPAGHIDFYVNGGGRQPGCLDLDDGVSKIFSCSHQRSYMLFIESIATGDAVKGYPCASYSEFTKGACSQCPSHGCPSFGYDSIKQKSLSSGNFYLKTASDTPLLVPNYKVTFKTGTAMLGDLLGGAIRVKLTGSKGVSEKVSFERRKMGRGTTESFVAGVKDVGVPSFLEIWHADPFQKWNLRKVVVEKFERSARYYACTDVWLNSKNNQINLSRSTGQDEC
ncbi:pancreatic lipase-related protein 2-like isoform X2 [Rhopilema esculentum]|uniref:pancreatic lipase-related protein 2-like isoform X2 n=1 Tax=Rhopilema esculentum TaxID=499914 RepID=UPI0031DA8092